MVTRIQDITPLTGRMASGIAGLDVIMSGGFLHGNSILLQGTPGSGKTGLGMQIVANGITKYDEPGLIFSFEQFPQQLYRDAASFGWDFEQMERNRTLRVIFARRDDLYSSFPEKESDAITHITDAAIDLGAKRILIDSASMFWRLPLSEDEQRKLFFEFVMKLKGLGITPILTSELAAVSDEFSPEEFAVDTILKLEHTLAAYAGGNRMRTIEVVKTRGQHVIEGKHPFRIRNTGIQVFPYIQLGETEQDKEPAADERCSFGISGLDNLLNGGLQAGTTTMIAGMTGTGKTTLAGYFLSAGIRNAEPGLFISLDERPGQILLNMTRRGLGFQEAIDQKQLTIVQVSGAGLHLMAFYYQLRDLLNHGDVRRVVIDGLREFLSTAADEHECSYYLTIYKDLFRRCDVTALCTWNVDSLSGLPGMTSIPHSSRMDAIIYVGLQECENRMRKVIFIFKNRGQFADSCMHELELTNEAVTISPLNK